MQTAESIKAIIARCSFPGYTFDFDPNGGVGGAAICEGYTGSPRVRVHCPDGVCNETGRPLPWNGRWWQLSYHMVDTEIVQTLFLAIRVVTEHELRENFRFDGVTVFDSHLDIHQLAALRRDPHSISERAPLVAVG